ncbi:MarR family winged helix-turn-helix transcriptional regulator [Furfurilactobacillus entadae]|uniref:MarR family winged helix-turn-helix transcriptional regulator n=1 Tax=Furfurilactobacillus entadae TaxID=2922307 RepID=UPI0035F0F341
MMNSAIEGMFAQFNDARALQNEVQGFLKKAPFNALETQMLLYLQTNEKLHPGEFGRAVKYSPVLVSNSARRLIEQGLIETRMDRADRRGHYYRLTAKGMRRANEVFTIVKAYAERKEA